MPFVVEATPIEKTTTCIVRVKPSIEKIRLVIEKLEICFVRFWLFIESSIVVIDRV